MKKKMKTLKLNRETVARLDNDSLHGAQGGVVAAPEKCTGCPSGCGIFPDPVLDTE